MRVSCTKLLELLEDVAHGLATQERIEQSSRFIFRKGIVETYNDDVYCRAKTPFPKEWQAAVPGRELLTMLARFCGKQTKFEGGIAKPQPDAETVATENVEVQVELVGDRLRFSGKPAAGKKQGFYIKLETEIHLPTQDVEPPTEYKELPKEFLEALLKVAPCASKKDNNWALTCVRVTPDYIEACDNFQMARYTLKTGFKKPVLLKADAVRRLKSLDVTHFCETEGWVHFKGHSGVRLSCRRFTETEDFADLTELLVVRGVKTAFPKGLKEAAHNANELSKQNPDDNYVTVELQPGDGDKKKLNLKLTGDGPNGGYWRKHAVKYDGDPISFMISPQLLADLTENYNSYLLDGNERLIVKEGSYVYVVCLCTLSEEPDPKAREAVMAD